MTRHHMVDIASIDTRVADILDLYHGEGAYTDLFVPTRDEIRKLHETIEQITQQIKENDIPSFWQQHFTEILNSLAYQISDDMRFPERYIDRLAAQVRKALATREPSLLEQLEAKLPQTQELVNVVVSHASIHAPSRKSAICNSIGVLLTELRRASQEYGLFRNASMTLGNYLPIACETFNQLPNTASPDSGVMSFHHIIKQGFAWDLDDVLSWYLADLDKCKEEFFAIGRRIDPKRTPFEILEQDLGAYPNPQMMFEAQRMFIDIAKESARDYIRLPESEHCTVGPLREIYKQVCPWGIYENTSMSPTSLVGTVGLNEDNYRAVTRGWLQMMAVHECYPGHHAHYVKTMVETLPRSFKTHSWAGDYHAEGIAHRSERMLEEIYGDPVYPLFVAYRRLHCTVRIKAEIDLHHFHVDPDRVVEDYKQIMDFNDYSARVQTQAHLLQPGRALSYYTGMRTLETVRTALGINEKEFTELIFSHGRLSIGTMMRLVASSELRAEIKEVAMLQR